MQEQAYNTLGPLFVAKKQRILTSTCAPLPLSVASRWWHGWGCRLRATNKERRQACGDLTIGASRRNERTRQPQYVRQADDGCPRTRLFNAIRVMFSRWRWYIGPIHETTSHSSISVVPRFNILHFHWLYQNEEKRNKRELVTFFVGVTGLMMCNLCRPGFNSRNEVSI
jgi:hypothetical protein